MSNYTYRDLAEPISYTSLTNPANRLLLGLAKSSGWLPTEDPQHISPRTESIPEVLGYLKIDEVRRAWRTESNESGADYITLEGKHYQLDWLEQSVYIRSAALEHNLLRADSFRVLFLAQQVIFVAGVNTDKDFFYPEQVLSAEWFYASCFSPVYKQHRLSQHFKLVINCDIQSSEPADHDDDGLFTVTEEVLGTDPTNPDTDDDARPDGSDPNPLVSGLIKVKIGSNQYWQYGQLRNLLRPKGRSFSPNLILYLVANKIAGWCFQDGLHSPPEV